MSQRLMARCSRLQSGLGFHGEAGEGDMDAANGPRPGQTQALGAGLAQQLGRLRERHAVARQQEDGEEAVPLSRTVTAP